MSGILNSLESAVGGMMGGGNNQGNNAGQQGQQGGMLGGNNNNGMGNQGSTDRYEPVIQQGEGYVKQHYGQDANVMRGERFVEEADSMRLGRGNMQGNMQQGVGGMMSSDPNVSAQHPQAGGAGTGNYGANAGMGPATGLQQQQM